MKNYRIFFVAAVVCAVLAALVGVYGYNTVAKMDNVVIASRDIIADETASDGNITVGKEPAGSLKADSVQNINEIKGMVAKGFVPAGTPLRKSMFMQSSGAGAAARLSAMEGNKVAIALPDTIDTSVGKALKKGDKVAVKGATKAGAKTVLCAAADVLEVVNKEKDIIAVILALTPTEAEQIATARATNQIVWCELLPVRS